MNKKRLFFLLTGSALFLLFVFFSYIVHKDALTQIDFNTTVRLQDNLSRRLDPLFSWFSIFGQFEVLLIILILLLFGFRKIYGGVIAFGLFGLFHIIEIFGKTMVNHPPPPQFMLRTDHPIDFPQFHVRLESSYPSGHSGRTVFIAVLLLVLLYNSSLQIYLKLLLSLLILGFVSVMLVSRIYLGEHWFSDVVGGALLAASFGMISATFLIKQKAK